MGIMNTIFMALEFGTGWFYLTSFVVFVVVLALEENDHEYFSLGLVVGFIYLMETAGTFNIFSDPWQLAQWVGVYFVAGVFWSFVKWFAFLHQAADCYRELRMNFLQRSPGVKIENITEKTKVPDNMKREFNGYLKQSGYLSRQQYNSTDPTIIPQIRDNKARCIRWIIWWPTSAMWTALSDPLVRVGNWLFNRFRGTYQLLANRVFAGIE